MIRHTPTCTAPPLTDVELASSLTELVKWGYMADVRRIRRCYRFRDFADALVFVTRLSIEAEKSYHHPDIELGWGYVTITLTTHDVGAVTEKDIALAKTIETLGKHHAKDG